MSLSGRKLAGDSSKRGRVENDYYATNPLAVEMLLDKYELFGEDILEPCVGDGNIARVLMNCGCNVIGVDIVDRGFENTIVTDFLKWETDKRFDGVVTNPPFCLAREFVEKSLSLLKENGSVCMFLKIQFLEGSGRKDFFDRFPPKFIYVFRNRMSTWRNGSPLDENGKKMGTVICFGWFVWEKENGVFSKTEPIIRWL